MAELDTNFVDAVLSANMNGKKRVRLTQIAENEYIVEDITEYEKVGSEYGQKEINTLNETVNGKVDKVEVIDDLDTVKAVTEDNVPVGCKAVTKFANDVEQSLRELNEGIGCAYVGIRLVYKRDVDIAGGLYISTDDGFVQGIAKTDAKFGNPFIRLEINDNVVFEGSGLNKNYSYLWSPLFEVRKGDIIKYTLTSDTDDSNKELRIYPHRAR